MTAINQKEYLRKYLSLGNEPGKKKKRKKKLPGISDRVKIIDDDIDVATFNQAVEEDINAQNDDAPQIVGVIDDRPLELRINDYRDSDMWKQVGSVDDTDDENIHEDDKEREGNVIVQKMLARNDTNNEKRPRTDKYNDYSPPRGQGKERSSVNKESTKVVERRRRNSDNSPPRGMRRNNDMSPVRRNKNLSDEYSSRRNEKRSPARWNRSDTTADFRKNDFSPRRRNSDRSPSRRHRRGDDMSPPRKNRRNNDSIPIRRYSNERNIGNFNRRNTRNSDPSPPRNSNMSPLANRKNSDANPPRRNRRNSDVSPPRKITRDSDTPLPARNKRSSDISPLRYKGNDYPSPSRRSRRTSKGSTPRRNQKHIDESPPRQNSKETGADADRRNRRNSDASSPRRDRRSSGSNPTRQRIDRDSSDRYKKFRNESRSPSKQHIDAKDYDRDGRASRSTISKSRNSPSNDRQLSTKSSRMSRWDKEPPKPPSSPPCAKTPDPKKSGLQRANDIIMGKDPTCVGEPILLPGYSGNAAPIMRDRQTGRIRDFKKEEEEVRKKQEKQDEMNEKYARWGKGLKQVEDANEKLNSDLHEMEKPLARYADDEDLEKYLKEMERDGDPMLEYLRKKRKRQDGEAGKPIKLQFEGEFMPNRYGLRPGHRWDGVDRSNGYEKKWFEVMNAKRAQQEEAYKWSTEDM